MWENCAQTAQVLFQLSIKGLIPKMWVILDGKQTWEWADDLQVGGVPHSLWCAVTDGWLDCRYVQESGRTTRGR